MIANKHQQSLAPFDRRIGHGEARAAIHDYPAASDERS